MTSLSDSPGTSAGDGTLSAMLRSGTQDVHTRAERSGIIRDLLRGTVGRQGYVLYLRSLLPIYRTLEDHLERRRREPTVAVVARPELYRSVAIEADLLGLHGADWRRGLPLLPAAGAYAARVEAAASEVSGGLLVAHAYVRYLGDLSGGQILLRLLGRTLALPDSALSTYVFPHIPDPQSFKAAFRRDIDLFGATIAQPGRQRIVDEAVLAFDLNILLSEAVHAMAHPAGSPLAAV